MKTIDAQVGSYVVPVRTHESNSLLEGDLMQIISTDARGIQLRSLTTEGIEWGIIYENVPVFLRKATKDDIERHALSALDLRNVSPIS